MRFSIIVGITHEGANIDKITASIINQNYSDWELIIVNRFTTSKKWLAFASSINDARILYKTAPPDASVCKMYAIGIESATIYSTYTIFLNDTHHVAPDTLATFLSAFMRNQSTTWCVSNVALQSGSPITFFKKHEGKISFLYDYGILNNGGGCWLNCIDTKILRGLQLTTSHNKHNGWLFLANVALRSSPYFTDHNAAIASTPPSVPQLRSLQSELAQLFLSLVEYLYTTKKLRFGILVLYLLHFCKIVTLRKYFTF
jgi:glycosyltransferase involved in cell wall biosynthesis